MNKTLLLILCDFLLLNLLALTRWEKAEPTRLQQTPVPEAGGAVQTKEQDMLAALQQSLSDEKATREQLASTLNSREQNLAALQGEKANLQSSLAETQKAASDLSAKFNAASQEALMSKEQLAAMQKELEDKRAEAERQAKALSTLEKDQAEARQKIEGLSVAVKVAEQEKLLLKESADTYKQQAQAERTEREKVQATTVQLAEGVGQLAEKSGQLTKEIRENRPINPNTLFTDFQNNRVKTTFTASRPGLLGTVNRSKESQTVFVTDGAKTYALLHLADTPFSFLENPADWAKIGIEFSKPPAYHTTATSFSFLSVDPRVIAVPLDDAQVKALGVKVYQTALDPFKFADAVLINEQGTGYGQVSFKIDPSQPSYVRVDNRLMKRLFGDFAPSRGDLVFSQTGELLGIMVNSDYCAVINNFLPAKTIKTGEDVTAQATSGALDAMLRRFQSLPLKLQ